MGHRFLNVEVRTRLFIPASSLSHIGQVSTGFSCGLRSMSSSSKGILTVPTRPETSTLKPENVALTWSSDGSRIALFGWLDYSIDLYHSLENNNYSGTVLHGHEDSVLQTAFTSNSRRLISRSRQTVQAWNAETKAWTVIYKVTEGEDIYALAVLPGRSDHVLISSSAFSESPTVVYGFREV